MNKEITFYEDDELEQGRRYKDKTDLWLGFTMVLLFAAVIWLMFKCVELYAMDGGR